MDGSTPQDSSAKYEPGKLFVGGLNPSTEKVGLKAYFSQWGEVSDTVIMIDPYTTRSRGFGFVTYANPADADIALSKGPHMLDNKKIDPKPAAAKNTATEPGAGHTRKIFIGGVAQGTTDDDVRKCFGEFGTVTDVDLKHDKTTQRMRGFGFVEFETEEEVDKLVKSRTHVQINQKTVEIKKATPRGGYTGGNYGRGQQMPGYQQMHQQPYGSGSYGRGYGQYGAGYPPQASYYQAAQYGYGGGYPNQYSATPQYGGQTPSSSYPQYSYDRYNGTQQTSAGASQYPVDQTMSSYQSSGRSGYATGSEGYSGQASYAGYDYSQQQQAYSDSTHRATAASYGRGGSQAYYNR